MFRWRIGRVEDQRLIPGVAEIVLRPGRDGALVTGFDRVRVPGQVGMTGSRNEGEDLIGVRVDLVADLASHGNRHEDDLCVAPGPDDLSEIRVGLGDVRDREVLDIDRKSTRLNSSHVSISYAVF